MFIRSIYKKLIGVTHIGNFERLCIFKKKAKNQIRLSRRIIDAGCGDGFYAFFCSQKNNNAAIFAYDISLSHVLKENNSFGMKKISFYNVDLVNFFPHSDIDFVYCIDALEHIVDYKKVVENIYSSLKKRGFFYLHVPTSKQVRLFACLKDWRNEGHVRDGFVPNELLVTLRSQSFHVVQMGYSFGFLGKLSWEIDRITDSNLLLKYLFLPLLKFLVIIDTSLILKEGNGIWILAQKY